MTSATQPVALEGGPVACVGALDFDRSPTGIAPRRLPAWTRPQIPDLFMHSMVAMGSGVRFAFTTDSDVIELDVLVTGFRIIGSEARPPVFELVVPGQPNRTMVAASFNRFVLDFADPAKVGFEAGSATTICFDGLGTDTKAVELWVPHAASTELQALRIGETATVTATPPSGRRRWVHYGSSISHCMEADTPTQTWPAVAATIAEVELFSLGLAGECLLDQFVARTIRDLPADVISLKLGINVVNGDAMRERVFVPAVHGLLDTIREGHPDTPILVVSPIFCPSAEDHPGPTLMGPDGGFDTVPGMDEIRSGCLTLRRIRELLAEIVTVRRDAGDAHLTYLDGLELFGADDAGDLPDRLHPNNDGYGRMGRRFAAHAFAADGPFAPGLS
ncbi:MAG: GDSL-like Lipase/Acylhydrolase family [Ilumatobacteraceae bacterium]|nr:GDSL-like Lipase/Acylhydrolase family [Ilumatobacteraceae bacterium]